MSQLKLYPADKVTSGSVAFKALRALEIYARLFDQIAAAGSDPAASLEHAVHLSNLHETVADLHRRRGRAVLAAAYSGAPPRTLAAVGPQAPGQSFVLRQLERARTRP